MRFAAIVSGAVLALILASQEKEPATIRTDVNLVQLNVRVTDSAGRTVSGLKKEAFELRVDGVTHPITVFQGEDAPVTAGIVVDNSASMAPKRADVIAAAMAFARASNPRDQMFVVHFAQQARFGLAPGAAFTGDPLELERAISHFELGGVTALYDALLLALDHLDLAAYNRRVLLIITDGRDNSSKASLADCVNEAKKKSASIYAIGVWGAQDAEANPQALNELTQHAGGEAFFPSTSAEIPRLCEDIARTIRQQYTLGFPGAQDGAYHRIELRVRDPRYTGLSAHTRAGYFAASL